MKFVVKKSFKHKRNNALDCCVNKKLGVKLQKMLKLYLKLITVNDIFGRHRTKSLIFIRRSNGWKSFLWILGRYSRTKEGSVVGLIRLDHLNHNFRIHKKLYCVPGVKISVWIFVRIREFFGR